MSHKWNAGNIFLGVLAIATVRDCLEVVLEGRILLQYDDPFYSLKNYFLHFNSFYFLVYVSLSLILFLFARKKVSVSESFLVGALAMMLIWIGPLFDYFIFGTFDMFYPRDPMDVICNLHHLADPFYDFEGLSHGMRVEIILVCLGGMGFLWYKTRKVVLSVCGGICLSLTSLAIGLIIPFVTQYYEFGFNFGYHPLYNSTLLHQGFVVHGTPSKIALIYLFLCLVLFSLAYYLRNPKYFIAVLKNFRWSRTVHYLLLFGGGMMYIYNHPPLDNQVYAGDFGFLYTIWSHPIDIFGIFMASVAVFLSFQSAVILNDVYDYDIDAVCNADRPLVAKTMPLPEYLLIGKIFAILALVISFCINETFSLFMLLYLLFAFLYSVPPFRLRKYFFISNLELATIFLLTFHAGSTVLVSSYCFENIPSFITFGLLASYILAITAKDFKDYDGDKKSHIQTLQTILGKKVGGAVTVISVCCAIFLPLFLFHLTQLLIFSIVIFIAFLLVVLFVKAYKLKETIIFLLYYLYLVVLFYFIIK